MVGPERCVKLLSCAVARRDKPLNVRLQNALVLLKHGRVPTECQIRLAKGCRITGNDKKSARVALLFEVKERRF